MLLIDKPFLDGSAVAYPENEHPERAFGHRAWLGHLVARQQARDYGKQPLTVDFMLSIHAAYAAAVDPSHAGTVLSESFYMSGSTEDRTLGHVAMTDTSIQAVRTNPFVTFRPASILDNSKGWLVYGFGMNAKTRRKALQQICDWYNNAQRTYPDPTLLAAQLQRRIVSVHPFSLGINGRPSRGLMNWSLENAALPPSAPADFDDDVVVTLSQWRHEVASGIRRYTRAGKLGMLGCTDVGRLYDVEREQQYYRRTLRHRMVAPEPLTPGAHHDRNAYMGFMAMLRAGSSLV